MTYFYTTMKSPVGELQLIACDNGLAAILWENDDVKRIRVNPDIKDGQHKILKVAEIEINEYFDGSRITFSIPLVPIGTSFQIKVWDELIKIPFGQTISYREMAARIGNPKASRAVGAAIGKNPISIIIPCHRVIGSTGAMTGFAGGIDVKSHLLSFEKSKRV